MPSEHIDPAGAHALLDGRALIPVEDPADPRIAAFRDIRERDLTGRQGRFIAEGTVVLRMLAAAHKAGGAFAAESILILKNRLSGVADILADFPPDVPVYVAEAPVLDGIVGFHLHRGILALGRRVRDITLDGLTEALPASSLVLVGCGISNHDNLGAMFRNAAAFYADAVFLDETSCDPLYRKALRVSVGSVLSVPYHRGGGAVQMLERLSQAGFAIWSLRRMARPRFAIFHVRSAWRWSSARKVRGCRNRYCLGSIPPGLRSRRNWTV